MFQMDRGLFRKHFMKREFNFEASSRPIFRRRSEMSCTSVGTKALDPRNGSVLSQLGRYSDARLWFCDCTNYSGNGSWAAECSRSWVHRFGGVADRSGECARESRGLRNLASELSTLPPESVRATVEEDAKT